MIAFAFLHAYLCFCVCKLSNYHPLKHAIDWNILHAHVHVYGAHAFTSIFLMPSGSPPGALRGVSWRAPAESCY